MGSWGTYKSADPLKDIREMKERPELERLFGVRLDEKLHTALKVEAAKRKTTMSAIIRKALRKYTNINEATKKKGA